MRKRLVAFGAAALIAVSLTACSNSNDDQSSGAGDGNQSGESTAPGGADGAPITIAKPDGPIGVENNNPYIGESTSIQLGYANAIYEPMAIPNIVDPAQEPVPWLAETVEWNDDFTELTLTARSGVKWNDGEDFSAEDIEFTLSLLKEHPELDNAALGLKSVTADGDTVTVTFDDPMFVKTDRVLQKHILPKHVWENEDPTTFTAENPVGTGPYTLSSFTSQSVELQARSDYWGGELAVPTLYFMSYNDNTALTTALNNGETDWAQATIPNVQSVYVDKDPEHNVYWPASTLGIDTMVVNTTKPPFDDVEFRKAINMVIDRDKHAVIAREEAVDPLTSVTGIPTPAGDSFIASDFKDQSYKVDVEGAKKVLEDAGYKLDGEALQYPKGGAVTFELQVPQGWNDYVTGISLIADSVKELGIEATITTPDADSWFETKSNGDFDAILHWTDSGANPYWLYFTQAGGDYLKPIGEAADYNFGRYDNPELDKALQTYRTAASDDERTKALDEVEKIFVEDVPAMPIGNRPSIGIYNTRNYVGWPSEDDPYATADPTQVSQVLVLTKLQPA